MSTVDAIFRTVVDISWRSSWLVLVLLALRAVLRGHLPARVLFWGWIAVAIRLLLPFAVPAAWSPFNLAHSVFRSAEEFSLGVGTEATQLPVANPASLIGSNANGLSGVALPGRAARTPGQWMALAWGAGVVALCLARVWAYGRFVRKLRRSREEPSPAIARLVAEVASSLGFPRVGISVTDVVQSPALHGIFRPILLFPPGFLEQLTPREIRLIVAHELGHEQRRDLLAQGLIHAAAILHWFNPLTWLVARVARTDCELACDEFVLRRFDPAGRAFYGATLLRIVTLASCGAPPPLTLGVVESKQQIKRRIQMIVAHQSSTIARTVLGCALLSLVTGLSLTSATLAQPAPAVTESRIEVPHKIAPAPDESQWKFAYNSSTDGLGALFPDGVVANVGDKVITVENVRREVKPLVPMLERQASDQDDFNLRLNALQNSVIRDLIGRILLIKEFHVPRQGEDEKHIPESYVDTELATRLKAQFDNDRAKFLSYLRDRGETLSDYRHQVEEEIIYHYMQGQERNLNNEQAAKNAKSSSTEGKVHLRMIQLTRSADETDAALLEKANVILARLKNGESFEALAKEFSGDGRRAKGGDWGWIAPGELQPVYSEKLFALKKGEVSEPIMLKEGCFLLYAEDRG